MPSSRPYSGMSWDDLEAKINDVIAEFAREVVLVNEELKYRKVPSAVAFHQRVKRFHKFIVNGFYEEH